MAHSLIQDEQQDNHKLQQSMEKHAAQLKQLMNACQSGMFLFNPVKNEKGQVEDFRFTFTNRSLAAYVMQEPEALTGELGSKWFPGYKQNGLFDLYKETYDTGKPNRFDFHYNEDAIDAWLDIMCSKYGDEIMVTFTDFTTVKRLQLQLETSVQELKRSNDYLQEFAYVASHDLQEPLRKIQFYSNRLKNQLTNVLVEETATMLDRIDSSAKRLQLLIDDLLSYSEVSSHYNQFEPVDIEFLIQEVLNDLETSVKEKNAVINFKELPVLQGDKRQLRQLFQNLISNALKYSQPDVIPRILISSQVIYGKEARMTVSTQEFKKRFYMIQIADNGLGFEQHYSKKIFQIFQRLHGRSEYPGTGVGLAIVQKVVENHKGYITAEGEPGKGATFKVLLPY